MNEKPPRTGMDTQTRDEVFTLAALGREYGLDRAVKWIMAHMAEAERGRKRRKRKVKVRLERGLRAAAALRPRRLEIRGDSQLVINQLRGSWQMNAVHLRPYRERCLELLRGCQWQARWVPREENVAADALAKQLG